MKKNYNFLSLIPAKLKSYRLKNKNLLKIKNKSLLEITLDNSLKSKLIKKTFVSTNSKKILNHLKNRDCKTFLRLKKFSSNKVGSTKVIQDFIIQFELSKLKNAYIVYLQPTSPFRSFTHINKAINKFIKNKNSTLISLKNINSELLKSYYVKKKNLYHYLMMPLSQIPKIFQKFIFQMEQYLFLV